jgi:L-amino acid N-acyltransferase YncA
VSLCRRRNAGGTAIEIETQIRLAETQDCEQIAGIYTPYVRTTAISFETEPPGADEMWSRVEKTKEFMPWLVCDRGGQILGYAYADKYRTRAAYQWSASVSIYVDSTVHRRGVGRGLYTSLFAILKLQGIHNLYAGITLPDVGGSVGFHRSFGFKQIGLEESVGYKLGAWHHVSMWHLSLSPLVPNPQPPISVGGLAKVPSWDAALSAGLRFVK